MATDMKVFKGLTAERQKEEIEKKEKELDDLKSELEQIKATIKVAYAGSSPDIGAILRDRDRVQNEIKECEDDLAKMGKKSEDKAPALASFETLFPDDLKKEIAEAEKEEEKAKRKRGPGNKPDSDDTKTGASS